ncbi:MAG TPA: ABC transporter permease [Solirubrobacteraceae bacterium]|nr:ABC transporter permease [Solirubrobacteraceae bacterium]
MSADTQAVDAPEALQRRPANAWRQLLRTEARLFLREPTLIFWAIIFPLILTIAMGVAGDRHDKQLGGLSLVDVYVPVAMAMVIAILAVTAVPMMLATYREKGVLRRLSTTPMPPAALLAVDAALNVTMIVTATAVIAIVGRLAFGVHLPSQGLGFVLTMVLTVGAMLSLGTLVASVAKTTRIAQGLGTLLFFPMMFFAGLWVPRQQMSTGLRHVSDLTPLGAATAAIQDTMHGHWPGLGHVAVLAVYAIVLAFAASRMFRWE